MTSHINRAIAVKTTRAVATMWCVYAFTVLSLLPLIDPGATAMVQYISSGILQLILLPMLMVGTSILNEKAEARAQQDHAILLRELSILTQIVAALGAPEIDQCGGEGDDGAD